MWPKNFRGAEGCTVLSLAVNIEKKMYFVRKKSLASKIKKSFWFQKNNYVKDLLHWFWQTNVYLTKTEPKNPDLLTKSFKFVISKAAQKSIILSGYMMTDLKWSNTLTLTAEKVMIKSYMHLKNVFSYYIMYQ